MNPSQLQSLKKQCEVVADSFDAVADTFVGHGRPEDTSQALRKLGHELIKFGDTMHAYFEGL